MRNTSSTTGVRYQQFLAQQNILLPHFVRQKKVFFYFYFQYSILEITKKWVISYICPFNLKIRKQANFNLPNLLDFDNLLEFALFPNFNATIKLHLSQF